MHLREACTDIQARDDELLPPPVRSRLNCEMAATKDMEAFALRIRPEMVTLVPVKREEVTTEGGLDVAGQLQPLQGLVGRLQDAGIGVTLFVDSATSLLEASLPTAHLSVELPTVT